MKAGLFLLSLFAVFLGAKACGSCFGAAYCTQTILQPTLVVMEVTCPSLCRSLLTIWNVYFIKDFINIRRDYAWLWLEGSYNDINNTNTRNNEIVRTVNNQLGIGGGFNGTTAQKVPRGPGPAFGVNGTRINYDNGTAAGQWFRFYIPQVSGDPHFMGLNGDAYDVQAEPNKVVNLVSDASFSVNSLFVRPKSFEDANKNVTFLGHVSIQTPGHTMLMDPVSCAVTIDEDLVIPRNSGKVTQHGAQEVTLTMGFKNIKVESSGMKLDFMCINKDRTAHFNLIASYQMGWHASRGFFLPHGILGQTAEREPRQGVPGGQQGEGIIDGVWTDYVVGEGMENIMNTQFTYSRFNPVAAPQ